MSGNGQETGGPTIGGIHFPDVTQIFRHHPARPAPPTGTPLQTPVPPGTISGYFKYFAAGALCATVTHVLLPNRELLRIRGWRHQLTLSRLEFKSTPH